MIAEHHDEAARKGVKIVHCCGFDSIPSDLGTQAVVEHIKREHGRSARAAASCYLTVLKQYRPPDAVFLKVQQR